MLDQTTTRDLVEGIRHAKRMIAQAEASAQREKASIDESLEAETSSYRETIEKAEKELIGRFQEYQAAMEAQGDDVPKTFQVDALAAVTARQQPAQWSYRDEKKLAAWAAQSAPELVRTKVEFDKTKAKKALGVAPDGTVWNQETGEQVPGVTVTPGEVKYDVKVGDVE